MACWDPDANECKRDLTEAYDGTSCASGKVTLRLFCSITTYLPFYFFELDGDMQSGICDIKTKTIFN